jgi:hypothetical protein
MGSPASAWVPTSGIELLGHEQTGTQIQESPTGSASTPSCRSALVVLASGGCQRARSARTRRIAEQHDDWATHRNYLSERSIPSSTRRAILTPRPMLRGCKAPPWPVTRLSRSFSIGTSISTHSTTSICGRRWKGRTTAGQRRGASVVRRERLARRRRARTAAGECHRDPK